MTDYYCYSGGSNTSPYENWTKAATTLEVLDGTAGNNDVVHVASDHTESGTAAYNYTFTVGCWLITEDRVGGGYESMITGGGSIVCTSSTNDITINQGTWKGFHFKSGDLFLFPTDDVNLTMIDCRLQLTGNDNQYSLTGEGKYYKFINCEFITPGVAADNDGGIFANTGDGSFFQMIGGSVTSAYKDNLFKGAKAYRAELIGVNLSAWGTSASSPVYNVANTQAFVRIIGCNMPNITIGFNQPEASSGVDIINSDDSTGNDAYYMQQDRYLCQLITNSATYKTTGGYSPSESADKIGWQIVDKNLNIGPMFLTFPFGHQYNETLTSQTVTVEVMLANNGAITNVDSDDIGLFVRHFDASADTTLSSGIYTSPTIGDPLTTATAYSESGSAGDGWTYGGALSTKKAFSITQSFTAGRKGAIECIVWVRNIPANHELFINPVLTLS